MNGAVTLGFVNQEGATRLAELYHRAPLRVLFPRDDLGLTAGVIATTSGGLVGGDRLDIRVDVGDGAAALITAQAAEKVYRSLQPDCRVHVSLAAGPGAWLEWLPQETILFDGARLRRTTAIAVKGAARLLAGEILVFGRRAGGERLTHGLVHEAWEVRHDGRLIWADALRMDGDFACLLDSPACLAGAAAVATLVYTGGDAAVALTLARNNAADDGVLFSATFVGGILVARWLGQDASHLRIAFGRFWAIVRNRVAGLPMALPRVWWI